MRKQRFSWQRTLRASPGAVLLGLFVPFAAFGAWRFADAQSALDGELREKGSAELFVYARKEQFVELLDRFNRVVHPGEEVRFVLTGVPDEASHVLIASVDAAGNASVYYPYGGTSSAPVPGPGRWEVPGSIVLDETLGPERVFAFFSKRPLAAAEVEPELRALGRAGTNAIRDARTLNVPGTTQRSFLLFKRPRLAR